MSNLDISIVIPLYNEEESLPELAAWIKRVLDAEQKTWEVLFIDDGSKDSSWNVVLDLGKQDARFKGIKFRQNNGKSAALNTGFEATKGDVVFTMDADLQDSPEELPDLYRMVTEEGFDLVSGWKRKRYDPLSKTIPTKLFNWATRKMSGIELNDFNCGLKAYRGEVARNVEVYGEMHRYIPVIAKRAGFEKIGEKAVAHQARKYGVTKFGMNRFVNGFLDLLSITFMTRYGKKPMHFFGPLGSIMFFIGLAIVLFMGVDKGVAIYLNERKRLITENPLFYISLTTMVLGTMLFLAGFLGELITRNASHRNEYGVSETTNL